MRLWQVNCQVTNHIHHFSGLSETINKQTELISAQKMSHGHSNKDPNPLLQLSRGMPASTQGTRGRQSLLTRCLWNRRGWRHLLLLSNRRRGGDLVKLLLGDQADCLRVRDWPRLDRHRTTHFHSTHTPHLSQERLLKAFHSNALSSGMVLTKKLFSR